jgi:hypothetical protein
MEVCSSLRPEESEDADHVFYATERKGLTNRWSQPLAAAKSTFDFMKQCSMSATLAAASGGSAPSR